MINLPHLCPDMNHFDAVDFSECHSEEVISFFWRSVYYFWRYMYMYMYMYIVNNKNLSIVTLFNTQTIVEQHYFFFFLGGGDGIDFKCILVLYILFIEKSDIANHSSAMGMSLFTFFAHHTCLHSLHMFIVMRWHHQTYLLCQMTINDFSVLGTREICVLWRNYCCNGITYFVLWFVCFLSVKLTKSIWYRAVIVSVYMHCQNYLLLAYCHQLMIIITCTCIFSN